MMAKGKNFIALFLVFSLVALLGNLYAKEKRGADLIIQKKDDQQVKGELIAVKKNSLLLLDSESGADVSVDIRDIKVITIKKKSKALLGAGIGSGIGLLSGVVAGVIGGLYYTDLTLGEGLEDGLIGGLLLSIPCAGIGAMLGTDKTIQIEGRSESEIKEVLENLRKKARIPDYQ